MKLKLAGWTLTHAVLYLLSCRLSPTMPEAAYQLSNTHCHGLQRASSFVQILRPAPFQGPSPRLSSPPYIEIHSCQTAETSIPWDIHFWHSQLEIVNAPLAIRSRTKTKNQSF